MAPGTRPGHGRDINRTFSNNELFEEAMENTEAVGDPWLSLPDANGALGDGDQGFADSFVMEGVQASETSHFSETTYEPNAEYLNYLESKLKRFEKKSKNAEKVTSSDVLKSLKDVKEKQMEWNFRQGISSSEDSMIDSDSSGGGNSLTNELRRKMFPEQHALNETELLHLLEYDVIGKVFSQLDPAGVGTSDKN